MGQKVLLIAEKDSLGEQIAKAFGITSKSKAGYFYENDEIIVAMASGHLYQLSPKNKISSLPFLPDSTDLQYLPDESKFNRVTTINRLMQRNDIAEICNACDPGREGELIGSVIIEQQGLRGRKFTRLWASSQAPEAILDSYSKRKEASHYSNLLAAAKLRAIGDLVYGINASRAITNLNRKKTGSQSNFSAGRVQTPTLAMIVEREQEITNFKSETYWQVYLHLAVDNQVNTLIWSKNKTLISKDEIVMDDDEEIEDSDTNPTRIFDKAIADAIQAKCLNATLDPSKIVQETKTVMVSPPSLLDGTTLQSLANKELQFSLSKTMKTLQALYDAGCVSYPRSESKVLAVDDKEQVIKTLSILTQHRDFVHTATKVIENSDAWVNTSNPKLFVERDKLIDGHGAIIPTDFSVVVRLTADETSLYKLIVNRFIMAFYPPAEYLVTEQMVLIETEAFYGRGSILVNPGWTEIAKPKVEKPNKEASKIHPITNESKLAINDVKLVDSQTKPPHRFTEGKLVQSMKKMGLGTVATREPIVANLKGERGPSTKATYLTIEGKFLLPTAEAFSLIDYLKENALDLVCAPAFTAQFEEHLTELTKGQSTIESAKSFLYGQTRAVVDTVNKTLEGIDEYREELGKCPACPSGIVIDTGSLKCACNACAFVVYKKYSGTLLSKEQLQQLLETPHETKEILKFISSTTKKTFEAKLKIATAEEGFPVKFHFVKEEYGTCPQCKAGTVVRTNKAHIDCDKQCGFGMFINDLTTAQLKKLMATASTDQISYFSKKKNTHYPAKIILVNKNGNLVPEIQWLNSK